DDRDDEPVELALSSPLKQFDEESKAAERPQTISQTGNEHGSPSEKVAVRKKTPQKVFETWTLPTLLSSPR
ncbi:MAG: hypothetical protein Q9198_005106, partial [Flavoplaca austrocitrina]